MIQRGVAQTGSFTPESFVGEGTLVRDLVPRGGDFIVLSQANDQRLILPVSQIQSIRGGTNLVTTTSQIQEVFTRSKRPAWISAKPPRARTCRSSSSTSRRGCAGFQLIASAES
jgi:hypothetical protein